ncbi:MarR family winged helix-turn-helix transcriptional regulator [Derxia gummosa]|uniref:MarR family winged helix-turn-helix transcriptional regulator n=1 Tax=Derxia gummosa DSM 723 TaxID=1121388 RepID=A0A8B6X135_9BURK|nr:MarR family transcriptional regulator [Derxia gummosa]
MSRKRTRFVDDFLSSLLTRASHAISSEFLREVEKQKLAPTEWRVLATLSDGDGLTIGQLAEIVMAKQPTVTKIIDRMSMQGLVERKTGEIDKRQTTIFTTDAGKELVRDLLRRARMAESAALRQFSDDEIDTLKKLLRRMIDGE